MSRVHYFSFLVDDHGHPLSGAKVSIFLAGTETPAKIFDTEFGSVYTLEAPQLTTTTKGFFEFWISDLESPDGYPYGQKFKITWEKPGVSNGFIDWIDIFPSVYHVDETNFESTVKNKLVSDRLAFNWETHANHDVRTDFFPIHGLESFNPKGDINTIQGSFTPEHNLINKVISDKFAYIWDSHSEFSFENMIISSDTSFTSATSAASSDINPDIYNITAHGLEPAIFNDDDIYFNRLVSNEFMSKFASRDGVQSFTHPVSGIYPTNENHLTTKEYVDTLDEYSHLERFKKSTHKKTFVINEKDWISKQNNEYYYIIEHGFNEEFPNVLIWNNITESIDNNYQLTSLNYQQIIIYSNKRENLSVIVDNNIAELSKISQRKFSVDDFELLDDKYFITIDYYTDQPYPFVQIWDYNNRTIHTDNVIYKNPSEDDKITIRFDSPIECIVNVNNILNVNNRKTIIKDIDQNATIYFDITSWDYDGTIYSKTISHNTGKLYPSINTWDIDTNLTVVLSDIESIDENTLKVYSEDPLNIKLVIDDGEYYNFQITENKWVHNTWGGFYYTLLRHNLNTLYTNISTWNVDTNKIEYLSKISVLDYNTILLTSNTPINLSINTQYPEYSERIKEPYWVQNDIDSYEYVINHNKDIEFPFYSVWNVTSKREEIELIKDVEYIDENTIKLTVFEPLDVRVNISNGFVTPIYEVDGTEPTDTISVIESDWIFSNNIYSKEITHNLNTINPHIYTWDIDLDRIVKLYDVKIVNNNKLIVYSLQPNNLLISFENNFGDMHNYLNYLMNNRLDKRGDKMSGVLDMAGNTISNIPLPIYPDEVVNKWYIDDKLSSFSKKTITINNTDWSFISSGSYYKYTLVHNLDDKYPNVTIWNTDTDKIQELADILSINNNSLELIASTQLNLTVKVSI